MPILGTIASSYLQSTTSYFSIATVTVTSGGSSSIDFTSIPNTYTHLQLRGLITASDQCHMRVNDDTSSNYSFHAMQATGTAIQTADAASSTYGYMGYSGNTAQRTGFISTVLDYANTNKGKSFRHLYGANFNGSGSMMIVSLGWYSTSAITKISIFLNSGNFVQYDTIALYGMKSA